MQQDRILPQMPDELRDETIERTLGATSQELWQSLWEAADAVETEASHGVWAGGEQVDALVVDGEERPVVQMPFVTHSDAVNRLVQTLYQIGAIVPFDWQAWDGVERYRAAKALEHAPVADAIRMLTAIVRADRFAEGTILMKLEDGTLTAALRQLRKWYDDMIARRLGEQSDRR